MKMEQVSQTLKEYFSQFSAVRVLLPIAPILLYVLTALRVLGNFVSLGTVVHTLVYVCFFGAVILVLSNCQFRDLFIGTGVMGALYLVELVIRLFRGYLSYSALIYLVLYGLVAFLSYKKYLQFKA